MVYSDGSVYVGGWKDFKFHGLGKLVQEGGVVFEGEWREGRMHGSGSLEASGKVDEIVNGEGLRDPAERGGDAGTFPEYVREGG